MRHSKIYFNEKFNKLTTISFAYKRNNRNYWLFQCECGNKKIILLTNVVRGIVKTCGCLTKIKQYKKPKGYAVLTHVFNQYKRTAHKRNLNFDLTREQFKEIAEKNCFMCNLMPHQFGPKAHRYNGDWIHNGIDRYDNNIGYTIKNCRPCCKDCNIAKNNMNIVDFKNWLKRIVENNK